MAKFCISGTDKVTGQFYYQNSWTGPKCLCGFDFDTFMKYWAKYQNVPYNEYTTKKKN